jgi:DNA-binding XRE family transcriptional regulator
MADLTRISAAMKTKDDTFFKRLGARIAQARKDQDMTRVQLAQRLGVAQQTHCEVGRARIAADLLPVLDTAIAQHAL